VLAADAVVVPVITLKAGGSQTGGFSLEAQVQAQKMATVSAQLGGTVTALLVKAGDTVVAGQTLARIDERDTAAGLAQADAAVALAEAQSALARQQLERQRDLRHKGFVSQSALDSAEAQAQAAQAGVRQAQAARAQATLARGFAAITAPFAGVVQATHLEAGDLAGPGRPVLTLYQPGALRAVVQVPASRQATARAANSVKVQMPDGSWLAPTRQQVLPSTDPVAQTVEWRLDLPASAAQQGLSPGQSLRVLFEGAAAKTSENANQAKTAPGAGQPLRVPASAVLQRGELTAVYVAQGAQFVLRAVRTGSRRGDWVDLLSGVKAGEAVAQDAVRAGLAGAQPAAAAK
jgi:RND family efflux transporter MFP subunit